MTVNELCRREGIKPHSYYAWTKEFMEAWEGEAGPGHVEGRYPAGSTPTQERENVELKQLVAELSLEGYRLKKMAIPMAQEDTGTRG